MWFKLYEHKYGVIFVGYFKKTVKNINFKKMCEIISINLTILIIIGKVLII